MEAIVAQVTEINESEKVETVAELSSTELSFVGGGLAVLFL